MNMTDNKMFVKVPWKNPASGRMATIGGYYYPETGDTFVRWYSIPGHTFEISTFPHYMRESMQKAILMAGQKQFKLAEELSLQNSLK